MLESYCIGRIMKEVRMNIELSLHVVIGSWILNFVSLLITVVMVYVVSNGYLSEGAVEKEIILWVMIICNVLCGVGSGILVASLFSFAALFSWEYTQSVVGGIGMAGALVSVFRVLTKAVLVFPYRPIEYATYLSTSILFIVSATGQFVCMFLYVILLKRPVTQFNAKRQQLLERKEEEEKKSLMSVNVDYNTIEKSPERAATFNFESASIFTVLHKLFSPGFGVCKLGSSIINPHSVYICCNIFIEPRNVVRY